MLLIWLNILNSECDVMYFSNVHNFVHSDSAQKGTALRFVHHLTGQVIMFNLVSGHPSALSPHTDINATVSVFAFCSFQLLDAGKHKQHAGTAGGPGDGPWRVGGTLAGGQDWLPSAPSTQVKNPLLPIQRAILSLCFRQFCWLSYNIKYLAFLNIFLFCLLTGCWRQI